MKKKTFDCVEMKRQGAERIYQIIKDMTHDEEVAYWKRRTNEMIARLATARKKGGLSKPASTTRTKSRKLAVAGK